MLEINQIYNADCLEKMKDIPDGSVNAVITDLPFGSTRNPWDIVIPFDKLWGNGIELQRITLHSFFSHKVFSMLTWCNQIEKISVTTSFGTRC